MRCVWLALRVVFSGIKSDGSAVLFGYKSDGGALHQLACFASLLETKVSGVASLSMLVVLACTMQMYVSRDSK